MSDETPVDGDDAVASSSRERRLAKRQAPVTGWKKAARVGGRILKWSFVTFLVLCVVGMATIYVVYERTTIPDPNKAFQVQTSYVYYADGKHLIGTYSVQNRVSIGLDQVPKHVQDAVVAAENRTFYTDRGIDPKGILRAAWSDLTSNSVQGASTITQQYVKILYLSQARTWTRKIKEAFLAVKVDNTLSKSQILEGYLNTIYFGRGAYGIQAASQAFFGVDAKRLSIAQGAVLASVLNSPTALDPAVRRSNRSALLARYRYVLEGMVSMGNLDPSRAQQLEQRLPKLLPYEVTNDRVGQRGFMLELVEQQLRALHFSEQEIYGGGLKIVTTFSWKDQRAAVSGVKQVAPKHAKKLRVAVASIDPRSGALRAMYGGRHYPGINWALTGGQPGSTFKAYALAAGLKHGFTLYDTFNGSRFTLPDGTPIENEGDSGGASFGPVSLLYATEESINTAYVDMTLKMGSDGPHQVIAAATAAGVPRKGLPNVPVVPLGVAPVPVVDMAEGYATFADNGLRNKWFVIDKVTNASGTQYEHQTHPMRAVSSAISSNVTYALEQVVKSGTGYRAAALGRPVAGKTGTATADQSDGVQHVSSSWFIGYTPQLVTAVMYVRGDGNNPLDDGYLSSFFGGYYPAMTWTAIMQKALTGVPVANFPPPAKLTGTQRPVPTTPAPTTSQAPTTSRPPTTPTTPPTTPTTPTTAPTTPTTPPTTTTTPTTTSTTTTPTSLAPSPSGRSRSGRSRSGRTRPPPRSRPPRRR